MVEGVEGGVDRLPLPVVPKEFAPSLKELKLKRSIFSGFSSRGGPGSPTEAATMHDLFQRARAIPAIRQKAEELRAQAIAAGKSEEEASEIAVEHIIARKTEMAKTIKTAGEKGVEDPEATNTIRNIIGGLNHLDHDGFYEGTFAVGSSEFHLPQISLLLEMMGLREKTMVISSQAVLEKFGFDMEKIYPSQAAYAKMPEEKVPAKHAV